MWKYLKENAGFWSYRTWDQKRMEFRSRWLLPVWLSVVILVMGMGFGVAMVERGVISEREYVFLKPDPLVGFNESELRNYMESLNMKHIDILIAQSRLETGNWTSDIFKYSGNLFGMKKPELRATTCMGSEMGHGYFESWRMSVIDQALWQNKYTSEMSSAQYLQYLSQVYAEDTDYVKKIKEILL